MGKFNPDLLNLLTDSLIYRKDDLLLTCLAIYYNLKVQLNTDHLVELSVKKIITKTSDGIKLVIPLFINEVEIISNVKITDKQLSEFRSLFLNIRPGSTGNKETVRSELQEFIERTNYSMAEIISGTKHYIALIQEQRFIPNISRFIKEILETAIEESQQKSKDWIT